MTSPQHLVTPLPVGTAVVPGTLRARLEELRARGTQLNLKQAVGIVVPLCVEIANLHRAGHQLFVHPSSLVEDDLGFFKVSLDLAQKSPILPRDKACLAPEERSGQPGGARASVFAIGAILYELVSGQSVGPGMRRPSEVVNSLPQGLEVVLAKALVSDPAHRPDDLNALAQALHQFAPPGSVAPPPPADVTHLDHGEGFEVDVSMSLMPPAPPKIAAAADVAPPSSPYDMPVRSQPRPAASRPNATSELASLKARLESDPRPRYVVIKDGMDHGPFNAVECLQQIANHTFTEVDVIRDTLTKDERAIKDWDEFAPFAENARLHRDIKAEKQAIDRVVAQESKSTTTKAVLVAAVVGVLLAGAAVWFLTVRGSKSDEVAVHDETLSNIEIDGGLTGSKKAGGKGGRVLGRSAGGIPILSGGMSCEAAQAAYVEEMSMGGPKGQADLTAGQYAAVMNSGGYFAHCGVPDNVGIKICAAVQNGRAVGVTVTTSPRNAKLESCISGGVRGLKFPSHPKLDVSRTTF